MVSNLSSIFINASKERVWNVISNPALVKGWQYGSELITSWEPGTPIRFRTPWQGQVFEQWGTVRAFRPHEELSYSLFAPRAGLDDQPENYFVMIYRLEEADGGTKLTILQEDGRSVAVQKEPEGEENPVLQALKGLAEAAR
ncbi:SRPBCC family protein [Flaviaesturariibacter aridisoli]|uniref:SRPBCC domain-containing protein n=1 Tax=Flaviaesturariibacter aridisoli TaxID=2545761 RepID=A0A4R4E261_9BACT|nr:SRPBCC domain-containing protein [Flaviaesturariibacter aridisoli]TCZ73479.1 SRPBCC domain-containing protein [Flaviaesturariibacter aridisoli]